MKLVRSIVFSCLGGLLPTASVGQSIVWTDEDARRIQRKDVNGVEVHTIVQFPSPQAAYQIHYDPIDSKLYYLFYAGLQSVLFQRANLDGSDPENIPTPSWSGFTLNVDSRKLYWGEAGCNGVNRAHLDGTGVETHCYGSCCLITLEAFGEELFFGAGGAMQKGIWRADADGSNEQFLIGMPQPMDMAYDPVEGKLYVGTTLGIFRMNPDGTGFQEIVPSSQSGSIDQVEVDSRGRRVYWAQRNLKVIRRSNLNGSNVQDFVTASDVGNPDFNPAGLTIVYSSTPIPTLSGWGLLVMGSILLGAGIVVLRKRHLTQCEGATDVQYPR